MVSALPQPVNLPREKSTSLLRFPSVYPSGMLNYYELLSVPMNASAEQIRSAYLRFNRLAHPMTAHENLTHLFKAAQDAYDTLSKSETRAAYDAYLRRLNQDTEISSVPMGVPLGSFPAVKLEDLSWGKDVKNERRLLRHTPGGNNVESYQHAVVSNATSLLLSIPDVSLYSGVETPKGSLEHVALRRGQVIVISSVLCPVDDKAIAQVKETVDAASWLKRKLGRVFSPDVKIFVALLPRPKDTCASLLKESDDGVVDAVYGDLSDMIDQSGKSLLEGGKSALAGRSYRKILEEMKK